MTIGLGQFLHVSFLSIVWVIKICTYYFCIILEPRIRQ